MFQFRLPLRHDSYKPHCLGVGVLPVRALSSCLSSLGHDRDAAHPPSELSASLGCGWQASTPGSGSRFAGEDPGSRFAGEDPRLSERKFGVSARRVPARSE